MAVLEPSAGTGNIAVLARLAGAQVDTNEIDPRRRELLALQGFEPTAFDAERLDNLLPPEKTYHAVVMNPSLLRHGLSSQWPMHCVSAPGISNKHCSDSSPAVVWSPSSEAAWPWNVPPFEIGGLKSRIATKCGPTSGSTARNTPDSGPHSTIRSSSLIAMDARATNRPSSRAVDRPYRRLMNYSRTYRRRMSMGEFADKIEGQATAVIRQIYRHEGAAGTDPTRF